MISVPAGGRILLATRPVGFRRGAHAYLVLNLAAKDWKMPQREWAAAKAQFAILFEDRFAIT